LATYRRSSLPPEAGRLIRKYRFRLRAFPHPKTAEMDRRKNRDKLDRSKSKGWKIKSISLQSGHGHEQKPEKQRIKEKQTD
jgi:hypothetical protein